MGFDYRDSRDLVWGIQRNERGGFVRAVRRPGLSRSERAVLLALIEFAPNIEPSIATLAVMLETEERAVRRLLRALEEKGYLQVAMRHGQRSHYVLTLPPIPPTDPPSESDTPDVMSPRTSCPPSPDVMSPPPRTSCPPKQTSKADKKADKVLGATSSSPSKPTRRAARKKKPPKKPETELPNDWQPTEAHRSFAEKHGLDVELEAIGFRGHYEGKTAVSWNGRFTTWLANQAKWNRARGPRNPKRWVQGGAPDNPSAAIQSGLDLVAEYEREGGA